MRRHKDRQYVQRRRLFRRAHVREQAVHAMMIVNKQDTSQLSRMFNRVQVTSPVKRLDAAE